MKITVEDYEVINAYAGRDRSWYDRVSTANGVNNMINYSRMIASMAVISAKYGAMREDDKWTISNVRLIKYHITAHSGSSVAEISSATKINRSSVDPAVNEMLKRREVSRVHDGKCYRYTLSDITMQEDEPLRFGQSKGARAIQQTT